MDPQKMSWVTPLFSQGMGVPREFDGGNSPVSLFGIIRQPQYSAIKHNPPNPLYNSDGEKLIFTLERTLSSQPVWIPLKQDRILDYKLWVATPDYLCAF
jgi:hypothetical protein